MNILVTGGTGFIGSSLCSYLTSIGHKLVIQTRNSDYKNKTYTCIQHLHQLDNNDKFDVVINLAGEPIADKRWSTTQKQKILNSRLNTTQQLIQFFTTSVHKPAVFISGSAIGFYGVESSNDSINEDQAADDSFSSNLCMQWEKCALQAQLLGIRTCLLRTGIVLGENGGALKKMLPPFKLGLGGKIGSGTQWMSWIHIDDMIGLIELCINNDQLNGPINCTAPFPVINSSFTKTLASSINRPAIFPMPALVVKLLMGQMGEELLLNGKKVIPEKALELGYQFKYPKLEQALAAVIK